MAFWHVGPPAARQTYLSSLLSDYELADLPDYGQDGSARRATGCACLPHRHTAIRTRPTRRLADARRPGARRARTTTDLLYVWIAACPCRTHLARLEKTIIAEGNGFISK